MERSVNKIEKLLKKYKVLSALVISLYHERNGNAKKKKKNNVHSSTIFI